MYKSLPEISEAKLRLFYYFSFNFLPFVDRCSPLGMKQISRSLQKWPGVLWEVLAPGGGVKLSIMK